MTNLIKMKDFLKNISLTIVTLEVLFVALEILFSVTHLFNASRSWSEPDDMLGYRFTPNAKYWDRLEGGHCSGVINEYGWRDVTWNKNKAQDTYRIAVVGDSFVAAMQVESDETFLKIAEKEINDTGKHKVEIMNFGRSGFTTTEELLVIRDQVMQFSPDLVVLAFFPGNDIRDVVRELAPSKLRPFFVLDPDSKALSLDLSFNLSREYRIKSLLNPLKQHSTFVSFLFENFNRIFATKQQEAYSDTDRSQPVKIGGYSSLATSTPDVRYVRAFDMNILLITEIAKILKGHAGFLLVNLDSEGWSIAEEEQFRKVDPSFDPFYFDTRLQSLAKKLGAHFLGLQTVFRDDWNKHQQDLHWKHWNYDGHKVVAHSLAGKLLEIIDSLGR